MNTALIIFGPAGSGKSTFCFHYKEYLTNYKRNILTVNLDPMNILNNTELTYDIDIREYINDCIDSYESYITGENGINDGDNTVLDTINNNNTNNTHNINDTYPIYNNYHYNILSSIDRYGPNGGLFLYFKIIKNLIIDQKILDNYPNDLIIDFPGQIELFLHNEDVRDIINYIKHNYNTVILYLIDKYYLYSNDNEVSDGRMDKMDDSEVSDNNIDENINNSDENNIINDSNITDINNTSYVTDNITNNLDTIGSSSILIALITVAQFDIPYMFISTKNDIKNINRRIEYKDKRFNTVINNFIDENNFYALNYNDDSIYNIFYNIDLLTQHMDDADI